MQSTSHLSPTRSHATWKPGISADALPFFRCQTCGATLVALDGAAEAQVDQTLRRADVALPYAVNSFAPTCCGVPMERLVPHPYATSDMHLSYEVVGGRDTNALRVRWESKSGQVPRWIALKTFTGMQVVYVLPDKVPPVTFALADEDAYAYCNEDPCVACTFRCKRGFEIYAYAKSTGLIALRVHDEPVTR